MVISSASHLSTTSVRTTNILPVVLQVIEWYAQHRSTVVTIPAHENVSPIYIVNTSTNAEVPVYALATPWFENGNVLEHLRSRFGVDKLPLVKFSPLCSMLPLNSFHLGRPNREGT